MTDFKGSMAIICAPIAGVTDSPSRILARQMGADMTVSELISAEGIVRKSKKTMDLARFHDAERPVGIQLFGANPESMAEAAKVIERLSPDFIDLNFGCPTKKIVDKNGGASVLRNLKLMKTMAESVVNSVGLPVTVKMRSGWDDSSLIFLEAGKLLQDCGIMAITLHPRTRSQGFSGKANWTHIRMLKESLDIPVIGNGDIRSFLDAKEMFEQTGCDAVMIGRASLGNPWIFGRTKEFLATGIIPPEPSPRLRIETAIRHFDMTIEEYGLPRGIFIMRSRLGWYIKGIPGASEVRGILNRLESPREIKDTLLQICPEEPEDIKKEIGHTAQAAHRG